MLCGHMNSVTGDRLCSLDHGHLCLNPCSKFQSLESVGVSMPQGAGGLCPSQVSCEPSCSGLPQTKQSLLWLFVYWKTESGQGTGLSSIPCSLLLQIMVTVLGMVLAWSSLCSSRQCLTMVSRWLTHSQQWFGLESYQLGEYWNLSCINPTTKNWLTKH